VCFLDVVHQDSPQAGIVFTQQIGHRIDGHFGAYFDFVILKLNFFPGFAT
jgi:hypothetical protein